MIFFFGIPALIVIGCVIHYYIIKKKVKAYKGHWDGDIEVFGRIIFGGISIPIVMVVVLLSPLNEDKYYLDQISTVKIIAIQDNSSLINGKFNLFGGYINETPVYFYYTQNADGSIVQYWAPISLSRIYEDVAPDKVSYLDIYKRKSTKSTLWKMSICSKICGPKEYHFHVPPGSVNRSFNLGPEK